jgi:hypothetical protein
MSDRDPMLVWIVSLLGFFVVALGVVFGLGALGVLPNDQDADGFIGLGLGVLCIFGAFAVSLWDMER